MGFGNTLRTVLEMDLAPFERNAKRGVTITRDMSDGMVKSAKASAAVFEEIAAAEAKLSEARVAQARAANESITAGQAGVAKSARASAAVFEELAAREADVAAAQSALAEERRAKAFAEADALGKVKIRQRELVDLVRERNAAEAGTVERMQAQLAVVQQLGRIRGQRMDAQASAPVAAAGDFGARGVSSEARRMAGDLERSNGILDKIRGKFGAGSILTSVLGGVGLGSGFAIAEKGAELISNHWKKAAESAQAIAAYSEQATNLVLERINLRQTDAQRLQTAQRMEAGAAEALARASIHKGNDEEVARLNVEWQKAALNLETLQKAARERRRAAAEKEVAEEKERRERALQLEIDANERQREREKQAEQERADAQKKADEASRDALDMVLRQTEEALEKQKEYNEAVLDAAKAQDKVAEATKNLATANRDRVAFGVDEAAGGKRGTSGEQRSAKRIADLEARARRAYDRGGATSDRRDQRGNRISETGEQESARLLREADDLRKGLGDRLKSSDRDPLKAAKENLKAALDDSEVLQAIKKSLEPTESAKKGK